METKEEKKKAFFEKANANKANFDLHRNLIEEHLCSGNKMYYEDLKIFAERQVIDNMLLLKLMEYAEAYHEAKVRGVSLYKMSNDWSNEDLEQVSSCR